MYTAAWFKIYIEGAAPGTVYNDLIYAKDNKTYEYALCGGYQPMAECVNELGR